MKIKAIESAISHIKTSKKEDISRILFDAATLANKAIANKVRENNKYRVRQRLLNTSLCKVNF